MPRPQDIVYSGFSYVALRRLSVNGTVRNPGDAVPEAANWRNLANYISSGQIAIVGAINNHPGVRKTATAKQSQVTPKAGNKDYTHYRPVDHTGTPASIPADQA